MNHPLEILRTKAKELGAELSDRRFAEWMDEQDQPMCNLRDKFECPRVRDILPSNDKETMAADSAAAVVDPNACCVYLAWNSLGLMPSAVRDGLGQFLEQWSRMAVLGHNGGEHPWAVYEEELLEPMARLVGAASTDEVAIMNSLTINLHLLMISFYQPQRDGRYKMLFEAGAFPSDHYAFESQARMHGFEPKEAMVSMSPRPGEFCLRQEDILAAIEREGPKLALVCFSGVQYYTGQRFDIETITAAGHKVGAYVGWDLAHAVANVPLRLHEWGPDFAVWTTYKYLSAGPGNTGCAFLHERHHIRADEDTAPALPHLYGWWAHDAKSRMDMSNQIQFGPGIRRYQVSNPSALHLAALRSCLELFGGVDLEQMQHRSQLLVAYLEHLLLAVNDEQKFPVLQIITPVALEDRGCQLSIFFFGSSSKVDHVNASLRRFGVICDSRKPNVLRMAIGPLFTSYTELHRVGCALRSILHSLEPC